MSKKIKQKRKKYFPIFRIKNKEKGAVVIIPIVIGAIKIGIGLAALVGAAWLWWKAGSFSAALGQAIFGAGMFLLGLASNFFTYVLGPTFQNKDIVADPIFTSAWRSVRDMANMLIVLGFVAVGIATTLRIAEYSAKKILPYLILVALLINFSGVFCGVIIKTADVATNALLSAGGAAGNITSLTDVLQNSLQWNLNNVGVGGAGASWQSTLTTSIGLGVIALYAAWVFFIFAVLLASRYVFLAVLYILSPLAFFAFVFPITKQYWSKWWNNFIMWSFLGVVTAFFIYLAMSVLVGAGASLSLQAIFVSFVFLYIGYKMAKSSAAMGASAVIGLAGAAGKLAMGGVGKVAGGLATMAGNTKSGQRTKEWLSNAKARTAEALLLAPAGSAMGQKQKRAAEAEKLVDAMASAPAGTRDRNRYEQLVKSGTGSMGAAAVSKANDRGELGTLLGNSINDIDQRSKYAGAFGYARKGFEDKNHLLAGLDPAKVTKELGVLGLADNPANRARAQSSVNVKQLEKNWGNMNTAERSSVDLSAFHTDDARSFVMGKHGAELLEATRSLPATHATRIHNRTVVGDMIGANTGSNQADLDTAANGYTGATRHIDEELDRAIDSGDVNAERKWRELRNRARTV